MSDLPSIVTAILAALASNLGTVDLSGIDQVQEGTFNVPPGSVAFACLPPAEMTDAVEGRYTYYIETWKQTIRAWTPCADSAPPTKASTSRQLALEIIQALDDARADRTNSLARCVLWSVTHISLNPSAALAASSWAYAEITVIFQLPRQQ